MVQKVQGSQEGGKPHLCPGLTFRTTSNGQRALPDRKSTRLNSSHLVISYALFCLKNTAPTTVVLLALAPTVVRLAGVSVPAALCVAKPRRPPARPARCPTALFFNDSATSAIYTPCLPADLPI